jgi:hypothetical protein
VKNVKQKNLLPEKKQHAAVLQLSLAAGTLVFQICHTDAVPELLREFLNNYEIMFSGAAIQRDVQMLEYYRTTILRVCDLHREIPNPNLELILQVSMLRRIHTLRPIFLRLIRR